MSVIHLVGSNRLSEARSHEFRWQVDLPRTDNNSGGDYMLEVHSITIENYIPVIREGVNDIFYYIFDGVESFFTFDEGNYDIYELLTSMETKLKTLDIGFALNEDLLQYKVELLVPAGHVFTILRKAPFSSFLSDYSLPNREDRFLELLGWTFFDSNAKTFDATLADYTWVPNNVIRCKGPIWIDLCTTLPIRGSYSQSRGKFNVIGRAYITDTPFGSLFTSISSQTIQYPVNLLGHPSFELFCIDDHGDIMLPSPTIENVVIGYRMSFTPIMENSDYN